MNITDYLEECRSRPYFKGIELVIDEYLGGLKNLVMCFPIARNFRTVSSLVMI